MPGTDSPFSKVFSTLLILQFNCIEPYFFVFDFLQYVHVMWKENDNKYSFLCENLCLFVHCRTVNGKMILSNWETVCSVCRSIQTSDFCWYLYSILGKVMYFCLYYSIFCMYLKDIFLCVTFECKNIIQKIFYNICNTEHAKRISLLIRHHSSVFH